MAKKYLDLDGLSHFWQAIKNSFVSDVSWDSTNKKLKKTKAGTTSDVVTFSTVATSGSYNDLSNKPTIPTLKNVFGKVKVGSTTIEADTTQDTLELTAGANITLTPDATNDKVTIEATDTTYSDATTSASGLMSSSDKTKLNGIATGAEVNQNAFSTVSVKETASATTTKTISADSKTDTLSILAGDNMSITADTTNDSITLSPVFLVATANNNGLMSSTAMGKLDGIAAGAEVNVNADWNASSGDAQILNKKKKKKEKEKGVVTSISSDSANLPTVTAVKNYVASVVTGATAFQGTAPTTFAPTNYKAGYYWVIGTAGTYAGQVCEPGDMIFAVNDYASAYSASDFDVIQTNLDITSITNAEIDTIVAA